MKRHTLVPLLMGAASAASLQAWTGWWLNSGTGVASTITVLFVLALGVGWSRPDSPWFRAVSLWAGAMAGLVASLWWLGPGTIWPIVVLASGVLTACAVLTGICVASTVLAYRAR